MLNAAEMGTLTIPASGISLAGFHASDAVDQFSKTAGQPVQVMRLDLTPALLNEILKSSVNSKRKLQISFGRAVALHCGNKQHQLLATAQVSPGELYSTVIDGHDELTLTGRLSHKLAMQQVQDNMAETDAAMAMLQSRMASHKQEKLAKQIQFVPNGKDLPPPWNLKAADIKNRSDHHQFKRLTDAAARSKPASPATTGSSSGLKMAVAPTSQPRLDDPKALKLQALRTPLIHLLAVRPVSENFLAQKIGCTQEECLELLQKVARPYIDPSKWDLSDKTCKELNIWQFLYPTSEDRQFAVNRAITAFDRLRLAREDGLWQMLLPAHERGQGRVLSKLQLNPKPNQHVATPRINVPTTGNKSLSKRLLSNKPGTSQSVKPRDVQGSTKQGAKKVTANVNPTVKSAEFVHESDEEEDVAAPPGQADGVSSSTLNETKTSQPVTPGPPSSTTKPKIPKNISLPAPPAAAKKAPATKTPTQNPPAARAPSTGTKARISEASRNGTKTLPRKQPSTSPFKPSPLGSSPPTNASDLEHDGHVVPVSSDSSTPLISVSEQVRPGRKSAVDGSAVLKRKANDIDSGIHNHEISSADAPSDHPHKRPRLSMSPPTSILSTESSRSASDSPKKHTDILVQALAFKEQHANYSRLYKKLAECPDAPPEQVQLVLKMHEQLMQSKNEIFKHRRS